MGDKSYVGVQYDIGFPCSKEHCVLMTGHISGCSAV